MESLQAMGFEAAICRQALELANNNLDQAVDILLNESHRLQPTAPPTAPPAAPVADLLPGFEHELVAAPDPRPTLPAQPADPPDSFVCSITYELMEDPVVTDDGHTYERAAIEEWLATYNTSPRTGEPLRTKHLIPNITLRNQIREWVAMHQPAATARLSQRTASPLPLNPTPVAKHASLSTALPNVPLTTPSSSIAGMSDLGGRNLRGGGGGGGGSAMSGRAPAPAPPLDVAGGARLSVHDLDLFLSPPASSPSPAPAAARQPTVPTQAPESVGRVQVLPFARGKLGFGVTQQLVVTAVERHSQARSLGMQEWSRVVSVNGISVMTLEDFQQQQVQVVDPIINIGVILPHTVAMARAQPLGFVLTKGMQVAQVDSGSQAEEQGIRLGAQVVLLDGQLVDFQTLRAVMAQSDSPTLHLTMALPNPNVPLPNLVNAEPIAEASPVVRVEPAASRVAAPPAPPPRPDAGLVVVKAQADASSRGPPPQRPTTLRRVMDYTPTQQQEQPPQLQTPLRSHYSFETASGALEYVNVQDILRRNSLPPLQITANGFVQVTESLGGLRALDVVLGVDGKPLPRRPDMATVRQQLIEAMKASSHTATELAIFRCRPGHNKPTSSGLGPALSGVLLKRASRIRRGSVGTVLGRPWHERFVELTADGRLLNFKGRTAETPSGEMVVAECTVVPLTREAAGRAFAFEVHVSSHDGIISSPTAAMNPTASQESHDCGLNQRESLSLAAVDEQQLIQWVGVLREAITFHSKRAAEDKKRSATLVKELEQTACLFQESAWGERQRQEHAAQLQQEEDLVKSMSEMSLRHDDNRRNGGAEAEAAIAASLQSMREEERAKAAKQDEEARMLEQALQTTKRAHEEEQRQETVLMFTGLYLSSVHYANEQKRLADQQHATAQATQAANGALAQEQMYAGLAWDSYKLAVSYFLKALAIVAELDAMGEGHQIHPGDKERILGCVDWCRRKGNESASQRSGGQPQPSLAAAAAKVTSSSVAGAGGGGMGSVDRRSKRAAAAAAEGRRSSLAAGLTVQESGLHGRSAAVHELVESERLYVQVLTDLCAVGGRLRSSMPAESYEAVFPTVATLRQIHLKMLGDLDERLAAVKVEAPTMFEHVRVSDILNAFFPMLKIYTAFNSQYDQMLQHLDQLSGEDAEESPFQKNLREAMQAQQRSGNFLSLLIQPIQRVPRYLLLLTSLVEHTPEGHPDRPGLLSAKAKVAEVASHLDRSLDTRTEQLKLLELQNSFFPKVVVVRPGRRLLKRGDLVKVAAKDQSLQRYHVFLFNDALAYGTELMRGFYRIHRLMTVVGLDGLPHTDHDTNRFTIVCDEKTVTLGAASAAEKKDWLDVLTGALGELESKVSSYQRASVTASKPLALSPGFAAADSGRAPKDRRVGWAWQRKESLADEEEEDQANPLFGAATRPLD